MDLGRIDAFSTSLPPYLTGIAAMSPWDAAAATADLLVNALPDLGDAYIVCGDVAIHRSASVHSTAVISGPAVIEEDAVVGPHVSIRSGAFVGPRVTIGSSVELKACWVFEDAAIAHLNYAGNSVVGHGVNIEAGAVLANHLNERAGEEIFVVLAGRRVGTGHTKFGAAIGPGARIGANAVTSPGTVLQPGQVVGRLELIDQVAEMSRRTDRG